MKNKFILIFLFIVSVLISYTYINFQSKENKKRNINVDYFVQNQSWETGLKKQVPYKKGDLIEISFILKNYSQYKHLYDIGLNQIISLLKLQDFNIVEDTNSIDPNGAKLLTIKGTTTDSGITPANLNDYLYIDEISTTDIDEPQDNTVDSIGLNLVKNQSNFNISLSKYSIISNENNLIILTGSDIQYIKGIGISDKFFNIKSNSGYFYIDIPNLTFNQGKYFVYYLLHNNEIATSDFTIQVKHFPQQLYVSEILPAKFSNKSNRWISVKGGGLKNTISIQLSNNEIFKKIDFKVVSDNVLLLNIPINFDIGNYKMNIMNLDGIFEVDNIEFVVTE